MRSLESARETWQELQQYQTLRDLKDAVRLDGHSSAAANGLRSACWRAFLLFDGLDVDEWQRTLASSRSAYNSLRAHFFRLIENPGDVGAGFDPLSQDSETSPWEQLRKDEELRAEILQDVERQSIVPSVELRQILTDILFTFCKLNPDVGYRQGMHEIAAPILYVIEGDAIDMGEASKTLGEDSIIKTIFDADHIEHDSFAIFGQVMQSAKTFYASEGPVSIASRSKHIFNELLAQIDPELTRHLEGLDVVPQVYLIRWIRLLFGREFGFDAVLALWDVLFAEDPSLELVDHICLAMLLRIRWHLLDADYNNALGLLLRYPELDKDLPAQTLALDALYLRSHMNREGASYLVLKYTGRPLVSTGRPTTPPALQRNITQFSGLNSVRHTGRTSPSGIPRHSRNIEAVLQNTAKNIFAQGERLGIGKAVRNAVGEVHKKAQEIRDSQAPSPPPWRRPETARAFDKLRELERRNQKLSVLLSNAANELWEYQRLISETDKEKTEADHQESLEKLSAAIARVQFVQVYLEEPGLALPEDDASDGGSTGEEHVGVGLLPPQPPAGNRTTPTAVENTRASEKAPLSSTPTEPLADPSTFEDLDNKDIAPTQEVSPSKSTIESTSDAVHSTNNQNIQMPGPSPSRPALEQSAFSFMLGQDTNSSQRGPLEPMQASSHSRNISQSSIFGPDRTGTPTKSVSGRKADETDGQGDDFDFASLRRGQGRK